MFEENSDFTKWDISNDSTILIEQFSFEKKSKHRFPTPFSCSCIGVVQ